MSRGFVRVLIGINLAMVGWLVVDGAMSRMDIGLYSGLVVSALFTAAFWAAAGLLELLLRLIRKLRRPN
jgi:hypothetical protein